MVAVSRGETGENAVDSDVLVRNGLVFREDGLFLRNGLVFDEGEVNTGDEARGEETYGFWLRPEKEDEVVSGFGRCK